MFEASVVIPVHNAAPYIARAVRSALQQPETREVLLVEDGSTDDSLVECQRLQERHENVRVLRHPGGENRGIPATRNLGVMEARAEWIAFLDADDHYLPGRFRFVVERLRADPSLEGIYDPVGVEFESTEQEQWWRSSGRRPITGIPRRIPPEELFESMVTGRTGGHLQLDGVVLKKSLLAEIGGFDETVSPVEDTMMTIQAAAVGRMAAGSTTEPVAVRLIHVANHATRPDLQRERKKQSLHMAYRLVHWGRITGLPRHQRVLLFRWFLKYWRSATPAARASLCRGSSQVLWLARLAASFPEALPTRPFLAAVTAPLRHGRDPSLASRGE